MMELPAQPPVARDAPSCQTPAEYIEAQAEKYRRRETLFGLGTTTGILITFLWVYFAPEGPLKWIGFSILGILTALAYLAARFFGDMAAAFDQPEGP